MDFPLGIRAEYHITELDLSTADGMSMKRTIPDQPPSLNIDLGQVWLESAQELTPQECDRLGCPPCCFLVTLKGFSEPSQTVVSVRFVAGLNAYMALHSLKPWGSV